MRKRNLSVYDIQRELAAADHPISINALTVLLREEGFARLPRRRDEERPAALKPESADVADVRRLDLSPRSFRTTRRRSVPVRAVAGRHRSPAGSSGPAVCPVPK